MKALILLAAVIACPNIPYPQDFREFYQERNGWIWGQWPPMMAQSTFLITLAETSADYHNYLAVCAPSDKKEHRP